MRKQRTSGILPERPAGALEFVIRKLERGGKWRTIAAPSPALKALHHRFKDLLEEHVEGVSMSPTNNMLAHKHGRYFFQTDLADAFPSIKTKRLAGVLRELLPQLGTYDEIADFLARYCMLTPEGGLAQGAPASPLLFELYCRYCLDRPIKALLKVPAGEPGAVIVSRYVDDLTFSSDKEFGLRLREKIKKIILGAGFRIHANKTSYPERGRQKVAITGGVLPPHALPVHTDEFYRTCESQINLFLRGELMNTALPALRGRIAWFEELEVKAQGTRRNQQVRELLAKVEKVQERLKKIKEEQPPKGRSKYIFPKPWLAALKDMVPLVPYLKEQLPYTWAPKATGVRCPCPLCKTQGDKFSASPAKQSFHCRSCKAHGDIIQFVRLQMGWDYVVATVHLAKHAGLEMPEEYRKRFGVPVQLTLDLFD